jgi:hypothetical protein
MVISKTKARTISQPFVAIQKRAACLISGAFRTTVAGALNTELYLDLAMAHPWAGRLMGRPAHGQRRAPMGRPSTAYQRTTFPNRMNKSLIQPVKYRLFIHVIFHTLLDV